jgi:hypothetical protein
MPVAAQSQSYVAASPGPAPLYPYELQPGQSYAQVIAPGMQRPAAARDYPYVHCLNGCRSFAESRQPRGTRRVGKSIQIDTGKTVYRRAVEERPRAIARHPVRRARSIKHATRGTKPGTATKFTGKHVVHAEAEITILGPDRINIRLYRKNSRGSGGRMLDKK